MVEPGSVLREDVGNYWAGRMRGGKAGDRRAGVVWHTQGSGKSFSMLFFAPRVVRHHRGGLELENGNAYIAEVYEDRKHWRGE